MPMTQDEKAQGQSSPSLRERYEGVMDRVAGAAARSGRSASDVIVVAVTKYAAIDQVRELVGFGHADLGENQVQQLTQRAAQLDEFLERQRQLGGGAASGLPDRIRWHMIGHLQRNKVRKAIQVSRLIHSVDSLRLAEEIQAVGLKIDQPIEVLIQVNIAAERSKHGVAPAATRHLLDQIDTMIHIRPRGMMCMAPLADDPESSRPWYERASELFEDIRRTGAGGEHFDILSMGMSHDFDVAIECGANIVRVGSAIFGERAQVTTDD